MKHKWGRSAFITHHAEASVAVHTNPAAPALLSKTSHPDHTVAQIIKLQATANVTLKPQPGHASQFCHWPSSADLVSPQIT
jgi:hypothetical protein